MNYYIKYMINGIMCITGAILAAVFLVSDRWMRDPNVYSKELGQVVHRFNIGFHWTTLIGMAGVVLLIVGAAGLLEMERYVLGITALTVTAINLCSWSFFVSMSETYFELVLGVDQEMGFIYHVLKLLSAILAFILLAIMLTNRKKNNNFMFYRILAGIVLILSEAYLLLITVCNHWYLFQSVLSAVIVVLLFGGRMLYGYVKKRKEGRQENGK